MLLENWKKINTDNLIDFLKKSDFCVKKFNNDNNINFYKISYHNITFYCEIIDESILSRYILDLINIEIRINIVILSKNVDNVIFTKLLKNNSITFIKHSNVLTFLPIRTIKKILINAFDINSCNKINILDKKIIETLEYYLKNNNKNNGMIFLSYYVKNMTHLQVDITNIEIGIYVLLSVYFDNDKYIKKIFTILTKFDSNDYDIKLISKYNKTNEHKIYIVFSKFSENKLNKSNLFKTNYDKCIKEFKYMNNIKQKIINNNYTKNQKQIYNTCLTELIEQRTMSDIEIVDICGMYKNYIRMIKILDKKTFIKICKSKNIPHRDINKMLYFYNINENVYNLIYDILLL
ncbi:hypothetical protein Hokovirus_4_37 [Hokovirus HKV1]|uniref:Uncharacterized protein n=1 Tax=Hokovirus HKV1 TaxID=1977638 RepID=A0A1V0SH79_9VIRU|nr:hypothetical protein Hokovirus_4_37 [Hokovirus HKV1]